MYTYDDFEKAAKASGYYGEFSDADLKLAQQNPDAGMSILSGKKEWHAATTDDQRALANQEAEKIRRTNAGYTAGAAGNDYFLSNSPSGYQTQAYTDPYAAQKADTLAKAQESYAGYNPDTDPTAQAYHKAYVREGQRATQDALGTAAQATGGIPSSYAATAAAQAGQYYASKEADKTAELEENAYNRYMKEKNADLQILSALETLSNNDRSNYNTDRSFNYGKYTDELNYQTNAENTAQTRADTERDRNQTNLKEIANTMMKAGQFDRLKELGYTDAEIAVLKKQYEDAQAAAAATSSTGGSGGTSSGNRKTYYKSGNSGTTGEKTGGTVGGNVQTLTLAQVNQDINSFLSQGKTLTEIAELLKDNKANISDASYKLYAQMLAAKAENERIRSGK
jgi:hypothetical protein